MPATTMSLREDLLHALETLDLEPGCDPSEVKRAYLELAQIWHPDRFLDKPNLQRRATDKLQQINDAYHFLREHYADNRYLAQDYSQPYRSASPSPAAPHSPAPSGPDSANSWANPWANPWETAGRSTRYAARSPWDRNRTYRRWSQATGGLVLGFYVLLWFLPSLNPLLIFAGCLMAFSSLVLWPYRMALLQQWQVLQHQVQQQMSGDRSHSGDRPSPDSRNSRPKQEQYQQLQDHLVALAGGDAVARVLFKSLVDRYPGKSAEWYYRKAIEILEYQSMQDSRGAS